MSDLTIQIAEDSLAPKIMHALDSKDGGFDDISRVFAHALRMQFGATCNDYEDSNTTILVGSVDQCIVALLSVQYTDGYADAQIFDLIVHSAHRRSGYGSDMVDFVFDELERRAVSLTLKHCLCIATVEAKQQSVRFWLDRMLFDFCESEHPLCRQEKTGDMFDMVNPMATELVKQHLADNDFFGPSTANGRDQQQVLSAALRSARIFVFDGYQGFQSLRPEIDVRPTACVMMARIFAVDSSLSDTDEDDDDDDDDVDDDNDA